MTGAVAQAVDASELWSDLEELRQLGARDDGGVCRLALTEPDIAARCWLARAGQALGCAVSMDAAGNLFVRLEGQDAGALPVVSGSHLDSQPTGGAYDGAYGVVAALQALRAIQRSGVQPRRAIEVVAWTNEEGVRYTPGCTGAACFTGELGHNIANAKTDESGVSFGQAMAECRATLNELGVASASLQRPFHSFIEAHIEQGPVLEASKTPVGVVTGIQGVSWFQVEVLGRTAHAGTTPRARRQDALEGAMAVASVMREACRDAEDTLRFTIGRFAVSPDSINTVPDSVRFSIDLRHPEAEMLARIKAQFETLVAQPWHGCRVNLQSIGKKDPVAFPEWLVNEVEAGAGRAGAGSKRMASGAFHDALHLAHHCSTAMLFIPCRDGISHHPAESIGAADAAAGTRALAETLAYLAG